MKGLNRAYLIGHIGHDPEIRNTATGLPFLKLSMATPNARKINEEWVDTPDWHRLTAFGSDAEFLARVAHKGDVLAVECAIRPNRWTDKEGQVRYDVSLIVERILWVQNRRAGETVHATERKEDRKEEPSSEIPF